MPVYLTCQVCGVEFAVPPTRAKTAKTCSNACAKIVRGQSSQRRVTKACPECGRPFDVPQCHEGRRTYCSTSCMRASSLHRRTKSISRTGEKNPMWRGGVTRRQDGYNYMLVGRAHPFSTNAGYVLEHRGVMEQHLQENDPASPFLIRFGGKLYLSPEIHVHHRDGNRLNNHISNLQCVTPSEHQRIHAEMRRRDG